MVFQITDEMQNVIKQIANMYKDAIENADATASLKMWDFKYYPKFEDYWFEVIFEMPLSKDGFPYWRVVENGRKAGKKMPPVSAIEEWIKIKPVVPRTSGEKVPSAKQIAYLIKQNGIKPKKLLSKTLDEADGLINKLAELVALELEKQIINDIEDLNNI